MIYVKNKKQQSHDLERTYTDIEEDQYKSTKKIYIGKKGAIFLTIAFFSMLLLYSFEGRAEDGAGTYWTCSYCGQSNKVYEIWCSNCGR